MALEARPCPLSVQVPYHLRSLLTTCRSSERACDRGPHYVLVRSPVVTVNGPTHGQYGPWSEDQCGLRSRFAGASDGSPTLLTFIVGRGAGLVWCHLRLPHASAIALPRHSWLVPPAPRIMSWNRLESNWTHSCTKLLASVRSYGLQ